MTVKYFKYRYFLYSASVIIFICYLLQNYNVNYYDETGYIHVSKLILTQGLFNIAEPLRTYMYPLIISLVSIFTNGNIEVIKILISILQFFIYCYTVFFVSDHFKDPIIKNSILSFGLLNPYMIQSTTLFLTDLLATCAIVISLFKVIMGDFDKKRTYFVSFFSIIIATMIRPSSLIMLPVILLILLIRKITLKDINIARCLIAGLFSLLFFIPQLYNNVKQFDDWTPLIHQDLYEFQSRLAASYLKYGTVVIPNEEPGLVFRTPFTVGPEETIYGLIVSNFFGFLTVYTSHLFGAIDWGYIDTYIREWYPPSRIIGSVFLYIYWILAFYGVGLFLAMKKKNIKQWFTGLSLILAFLGYWLFIGTTVVESRFGYPLLMIIIPFAGLALKKIITDIMKTSLNRAKRFKIIIFYLIIFIVVVMIMFLLSFLLDYQTGRIDWFN